MICGWLTTNPPLRYRNNGVSLNKAGYSIFLSEGGYVRGARRLTSHFHGDLEVNTINTTALDYEVGREPLKGEHSQGCLPKRLGEMRDANIR